MPSHAFHRAAFFLERSQAPRHGPGFLAIEGAVPMQQDSAVSGYDNHQDSAVSGYDNHQDDDKALAPTIAVFAFFFLALGVTAAWVGLLLAHGAHAAWMLFESIAG
jgi:hypothetical protein